MQLSILLSFFFPFIDIRCFLFLKYKTSVLSNNRFAKETSFSKTNDGSAFSAKKNAGCLEAPRDFPPRKDGIILPRRVALELPSPSPRVCVNGQPGGRALTSDPNFLAWIGCGLRRQRSSAMTSLVGSTDTVLVANITCVPSAYVLGRIQKRHGDDLNPLKERQLFTVLPLLAESTPG